MEPFYHLIHNDHLGKGVKRPLFECTEGWKGGKWGTTFLTLKLFVVAYEYPTQRKYICKKKTVLHPPKNKQTKRVRCREKISLYTVRFASTSSLFAFISSKSWSKLSIWSLRSRKRPVFWAIVGSYESLKNRTTHKDYLTVRRCNDSCKVVSA